LTLSLTAIASSPESPHLTFSVEGCEEDLFLKQPQSKTEGEVRPISVEVQGQNLLFSHNLKYVCCAQLRLESQLEQNAIAITEINEGDRCRCMCDYSINASFGPLAPGTYDLKIYGVRYGSQESSSVDSASPLLFQRQVNIDN
ncbi:MAG: hypothetical protein SVX43_23995, partial [Cyanobacteriota bacterium]|nr:hypothetical protein [Cyanobacteriota bacterium]